MPKPVLYVFAISHYCEKARWALDHLGIDVQTEHLAPGPHVQRAKKLGAPGSSLPILVANGETIQGSTPIIDWADATANNVAKTLTPPSIREECLRLESRLDEIAGIHLRRCYYSEAMVNHPETVRPIFAQHLPMTQKLLLRAIWGQVRRLMIKGMDLGPEQGLESQHLLAAELDWLDDLLSDGRTYLTGDRFSRADLTAASLLAPLATPEEHPSYAGLEVPPKLSAQIAEWQRRPIIAWVREMYARFR